MGFYNLPPIRFGSANGIDNAKNGVCPNCGAQVNAATMRCEYCGTQFSESLIPIVVERPELKILHAKCRIDARLFDLYSRERLDDHILHDLAHKMALELVKEMDFCEEMDYLSGEKVIEARCRVVKKGFRY